MRSGVLAIKRSGSRVAAACVRRYERLHYRHIRHGPPRQWSVAHDKPLLGGGQDLRQVAGICRELFPKATQARIRQADTICDHVFDLLGSGPTRLSPPGPPYRLIDWHCDFKSGYRWNPRDFYRDIPYGHVEGVDIKVPWELSRFQHLTTLGQAYVLTGNGTYAAEFVNQIGDWVRSNPVGFGVNWKCTMEVAIRAANWLTAAEYFRADEGLETAFLHRLHSSIHEHGQFIYHHLERGDRQRTNHYLSDVAGLLFIAVHCPFFRESRRWLNFCIRELAAEMKNQVYADGCHFEASTCYHRLALELFFFATWLAVVNKRESHGQSCRQFAERIFGGDYMNRLHQMLVAVLHLLKPNGRMPQIGDNDSGRFLILGERDGLDMRYLLCLGAVLFDDPQFKVDEFGFSEDALWLFGQHGYDRWSRLAGRSLATIGSRSFPQAGWYVMRRDRNYCLVSCGRNGPDDKGGHAHNDKLSIELVLDGQDVVVDPGTYLYTPDPDARNRFRSTGHHNTAKVEGREQSGPLNGDIFSLPDHPTIRLARLVESPGHTCFEGQIEYASVVHKRTVNFDHQSARWRIDDRIRRSGPFNAETIFHLSPDAVIRGTGIFEKGTARPWATFKIEGGRTETHAYEYSPQYGVRIEAPCICARIPVAAGEAVVTTIFSAEET
jgi:hypothetical protein